MSIALNRDERWKELNRFVWKFRHFVFSWSWPAGLLFFCLFLSRKLILASFLQVRIFTVQFNPRKEKEPWLCFLHGNVSTIFGVLCFYYLSLYVLNLFHYWWLMRVSTLYLFFPPFPRCCRLITPEYVDLCVCSRRCVPDARLCYRWMEKRPMVFSRVSAWVSFPVRWIINLGLRRWHRENFCFLFC